MENNKERMNDTFKLLLKIKLQDHFDMSVPIALDFVKEYVEVDLYADTHDEGNHYVTIGMSEVALSGEFLWWEIMAETSSRLKYGPENLMINEISNIICWIHENDIELDDGIVYTPSKNYRDAFGFDYLLFALGDLGLTHFIFKDEPL